MEFENLFSTNQYRSFFLLLFGVLILYIHNTESMEILRNLGILIIGLGVLFFWEESSRKFEILNPYRKNKYDSKSEEQIANYFKRKNIIYRHHPEVKIQNKIWKFGIPFSYFRIEPDFYLPEFDVFVEYWGRIDDKEYKKNSYDFKKKIYDDELYDMISLYPKNLKNLDFVFTSKLLELLKKRQGIKRKYR